jgi:hypothetical protein
LSPLPSIIVFAQELRPGFPLVVVSLCPLFFLRGLYVAVWVLILVLLLPFKITQLPSYPFTKSLLTSRSLVTAVTSSESPGVKAISEVFHPVNLNHFFKKGETQWQTLFAEIRLLS